eukprot:jgi/Mesvir1/20304/Mv25863-RA.1
MPTLHLRSRDIHLTTPETTPRPRSTMEDQDTQTATRQPDYTSLVSTVAKSCKKFVGAAGDDYSKWEEWKNLFLAVVSLFNLDAVLLGTEENDRADKALWAALLTCLTGEAARLMATVANKTGSQAWQCLMENYEQTRLTKSHRFELRSKLHRLQKLPNETMQQLVRRAELLRADYQAAGGVIQDRDFAAILLGALTDEYRPALVSVRFNEEDPLPVVKRALMEAEDLLKGGRAVVKKESAGTGQAYHTNSKGNGGTKKCSHCGLSNHKDKDCWKEHPEKAPRWYPNQHRGGKGGNRGNQSKGRNAPAGSAANATQEAAELPPGFCMVTIAEESPSTPLEAAALTQYTGDKLNWVLDSAASSHMSPCRSDFVSLIPHNRQIVGSGGDLQAAGVGTVSVHLPGSELRLDGALLVPELPVRVLSVGALVKAGHKLDFNQEIAVVDNKAHKMEQRDNVYVLPALNKKAALAATTVRPLGSLWSAGLPVAAMSKTLGFLPGFSRPLGLQASSRGALLRPVSSPLSCGGKGGFSADKPAIVQDFGVVGTARNGIGLVPVVGAHGEDGSWSSASGSTTYSPLVPDQVDSAPPVSLTPPAASSPGLPLSMDVNLRGVLGELPQPGIVWPTSANTQTSPSLLRDGFAPWPESSGGLAWRVSGASILDFAAGGIPGEGRPPDAPSPSPVLEPSPGAGVVGCHVSLSIWDCAEPTSCRHKCCLEH